MPLHLISANKVENLQAHLSALISAEPLPDPFTPELILVPGMAMARWLNLQLAQSQGVAANIEYQLPAAWIWELAITQLQDLPKQDPLARETATWKIFQILPALLNKPEFDSLHRYLSDDASAVKRWLLSERIADVFDRYQFYRPDWIRRWSRGETEPAEEAWQSLLWRALIEQDSSLHRVAVMDRLQQRLRSNTELNSLPQRICCFALSTLPPLYIEVLQALAQHTSIFLFQHSPSEQYWADLRTKKQVSRQRLSDPAAADYLDTGNDLLASWGRQGQAFQDLLLGDDSVDSAQWENYEDPGDDSLLHRLQQDIFHLRETRASVVPDTSVQIAVCHSAMRECQVLHDYLLHTLQQNPDMRAEDILVMVPRISEYAPYVEAVFSRDEQDNRPFIPWNLSDVVLADEHPLITVFLQLLNLSSSRFTVTEVLYYLKVPEIAERFNLDQEACENINELLDAAQVRWGLNAEHKRELGLPGIAENTWEFAEDRLWLAYAMGQDNHLWQGIAALDGVGGSSALALGNFCRLLQALGDWRERLQGQHSAEDWQLLLNELLETFFSQRNDDDDKLQQIRDAIDNLRMQAARQQLSLELLRVCLQSALGNQEVRNRWFTGGVSFCGMRPKRSLPFRVICVLGMNDQAFPRREQAVEFDLMAKLWRPGDPRKGDEDRYLLLETLLCARQKLYLSYTGRSLKDNTECQPSVLLRQLTDFIDIQYRSIGKDKPLSECITRQHSMQVFSARNYLPSDPAAASFDKYWCAVAQRLQQQRDAGQEINWPVDKLPVVDHIVDSQPTEIELARLRAFLAHPIKWFFQSRLNIYLQQQETSIDEEIFTVVALEKWSLTDRLAADWLNGELTELATLQAEGLLPHGTAAHTSFVGLQESCAPLLQRLNSWQNLRSEPCLPEIQLASGATVRGQIAFYPGRGLLHYSPSALKGKNLLALWLEHLLLSAANGFGEGELSTLITRDASYHLQPLAQADALTQLQVYVDLFYQAHQRPLPVLPRASLAYAQNAEDSFKAMSAAEKAWTAMDSFNESVDEADEYVQLAIRHCRGSPLEDPEFTLLARQIYSMALSCCEEVS